MRPTSAEHGEYFGRYINLVEGSDVIEVLSEGLQNCDIFWNSISDEKAAFRYAEGKWSIKELVQHIIDTERIFCFRALAVARGESKDLPGYDHDEYANRSDADDRTWAALKEEYSLVRRATIALFESFDDSQLGRIGSANGLPLSARAAGFINAGHEIHHISVIKARYLTA